MQVLKHFSVRISKQENVLLIDGVTIHRQRTKTINSKAKQLRENFECPEHIVIHWDGKIIQVMLGLTEDRVAVVFSSTSGIMGKFLASPAIPSGTGHAQATAVHQVAWAKSVMVQTHLSAPSFTTVKPQTNCSATL